VRVSQSLCPLTSILSPRGERRYIRCYFQANCMDTKDLEEIFQISPIIPSPFDGGGLALWSKFCYSTG